MYAAHMRRTIVVVIACFLFIGIFDVTAQVDTPDNEGPVNTLPSSVNTEPNTPVAISASVFDVDVGAGNMEVELNVSGVGGSVTCGGTFSWGGGANVTNDSLVAPLASVNAALSTLVFTPQAGCGGQARLVLESDDQGNTWVNPCPHLPANPPNCILAQTSFVIINIAAAGDSDPANNPPVNFLPGSLNTLVNNPIAIAASVADLDVGGGNMEVELNVANAGGSVTCSGTFTWGGGTDVQADVLTASLASVNAALSTLVFTPQAGCTGQARFVLETDDQGNTWGIPCPHANPLNCILADTDFVLINIVSALNTTTTLTSDLNPSTVGDTVTFTATVVAGSTPVTTGSVTFVDTTSSTTLGTVSLSGTGTAALSTSTLTVGTHDIVANYSGASGLNASSSSLLAQVVNALPTFNTTTTLTSDLNPSNPGDPVTFTATVTAEAGAPAVTGTVTFVDTSSATTLGTVTLNGAGIATLSTSTLTVGTHTITATYSGASQLNASSGTVDQIVNGSGGIDTATPTDTPTNTPVGTPAGPTATVQPTAGSPIPSATPTMTLAPVVERCLHVIPNGAVQGRMLYDVRAFFAPNLQSETPEVVIPGNTTWWIVGASSGFYQLFITCPGNLVWVPASSMIPNYDEVWNGAPLPNAGG